MVLSLSDPSATPGQRFVDARDLSIGDATEDIGQPSLRIYAVELGGFDQGIGRPPICRRARTRRRADSCARRLARVEQAHDVRILFAVESGRRAWGFPSAGSEGMVVKPADFIARGPKGLVQPAGECRGWETLRIIYGPDFSRTPISAIIEVERDAVQG